MTTHIPIRFPLWVLVAFMAILLIRLPFLGVHYIPHYVPFEPWIALVPLAGLFWGMAGALACAAASLAGDALAEMTGRMAVHRALGHFAFALSARRLWEMSGLFGERREIEATRTATLRFILVALPGCFASASWTGLGAEMARVYPFPYVATFVVISHVVFLSVFAVALFRVAVRETGPVLGFLPMPEKPAALWPGALLLMAGGPAAYVAGVFTARAYGTGPFTAEIIGTYSGRWVVAAVLMFLLVHVAGLGGRQDAKTKNV